MDNLNKNLTYFQNLFSTFISWKMIFALSCLNYTPKKKKKKLLLYYFFSHIYEHFLIHFQGRQIFKKWLRCSLDSHFAFSSFFFFFKSQLLTFLQCTVHISATQVGPVHYSRDPQTSLLSNFFIKNGSHGTIYTFKNYFTIVFLVK